MNHRLLTVPSLLLSILIGSPALAQEAGPDLLVRYALLLGDRGAAPAADQAAANAPAEELIDWDYARDNAELASLFGLETVHTLQVGSARLGVPGGSFSASARLRDSDVAVEVAVELNDMKIPPDDRLETVAVNRVLISRDGTLLSAPTISSLLGDRAIVTSAPADSREILWLVLQVDRLPLDD